MTVLKTPEDRDAFAAAWAEGTHRQDLARRFGFGDVSSVSKAASRLGLPGRTGGRRRVTGPDHEAAFARDWALGMPLAEMAALHGFQNINSVTRQAQRQGLEPRLRCRDAAVTATRSPAVLRGGRWVPGPRGALVWSVP